VESMKAVDESFRSDWELGAAAEHNLAQQMPLKANGVLHSSAETVLQTQFSRASTEATVPGHHTLDRLRLSSTGMWAPAAPRQ
jgi:hypothetical protein